MAKNIREVPKKRQMPLWASMLVILVLLVATGFLVVAALHNVNPKGEALGFATNSAQSMAVIPEVGSNRNDLKVTAT